MAFKLPPPNWSYLIQSVPSLTFLLLWRTGTEPQTAGWIGCLLATALLLGLAILKIRPNPILLGLNIHTMLMTPLLVALFTSGHEAIADGILDHAETSVLVVIFIVGIVLTAFVKGGFIGAPEAAFALQWRLSFLLLILNLGAIVWSFTHGETPLFSIVFPMIILFITRNYLAGQAAVRS